MMGREEGRKGRGKKAMEKSLLYICVYWHPV